MILWLTNKGHVVTRNETYDLNRRVEVFCVWLKSLKGVQRS